MKTVAQKMGIKEKACAYFTNAPKEAIEDMHLAGIEISKVLEGEISHTRHKKKALTFVRAFFCVGVAGRICAHSNIYMSIC